MTQAFSECPWCLVESVDMSALDWLNATTQQSDSSDHNAAMEVTFEASAPAAASSCGENPEASAVTWYCQTDNKWEAYPAHICELLEKEYQHVLQGTSVVGGVVPWKWSKKSTYEINVSNMQQKNINTGTIRGLQRTVDSAPEPPCSFDASSPSRMIARQVDGHDSVMIRGSRSNRSKIKWWIPSGSHVLATVQSDTAEYTLISYLPNMTDYHDAAGRWPQSSGYIKRHNLVTQEQWESEKKPKPVMLALMDDDGVWSSSR